MDSIAQFWNSYRTRCIPPEASESQTVHTKMAFYAGAMSFMQLFQSKVIPAESPVEALQELTNELEQYIHTVGGSKNVH
jgi:hypothetical protein